MLDLSGGRLEVPGRTLVEDGELWLERGEHVSLVGPNGAGKTTLIEALAGRRELDGGKLRTGHNVQIGYLSQHAEELGSSGTVLEAAQRATKLTPGKARALLGRFLFSGEEAEKPMDGLSGGERRRLSLAILVASGANVLILDEPTNHLDIDAREALEDALSGFDGTVLLVSHDRALLDAVGTRTFAIEDGVLRSYLGGWAEYSRVRDERREAEATAKRVGGSKPKAAAPKAARSKANGRPGRPGRPRTRSGEPPSWSARSRRPRPRCARSRTSWPTRRRGPARAAANARRSVTRPRRRPSRRPTRAGRPPRPEARRLAENRRRVVGL